MPIKTSWTKPLPQRWISQFPREVGSVAWPKLRSTDLTVVREPLAWKLEGAIRAPIARVFETLREAAAGPHTTDWTPPSWLMEHQAPAARRIAQSLRVFGGAILADVVGLGKTYTALAVATRYPSVTVVVPSMLVPQWKTTISTLAPRATIQSHESLSRGIPLTPAALVIIDEAHRFRNPATKRYDRLARDIADADLLLVTATPVVNTVRDLVALLRLFLADCALGLLGIPSLDAMTDEGESGCLQRAIAPLLVARSAETAGLSRDGLPQIRDHQIVELATVADGNLVTLLHHIDRLKFPSFLRGTERALLRSHLYYRLASSAVAFRQTLRRHLAYIDRAIAAAADGKRISRLEARQVFGAGDELQFEMGLSHSEQEVDPTELTQERRRLEDLLELLTTWAAYDPKACRLAELVRGRGAAKTIVFTTARATAVHLARQLAWHRAAVVTGGHASIATGRCSVHRVLDLFSPTARRVSAPPSQLTVNTLIATDVASEGLDLQDADAVIHYDIPWTPLRLVQRLGRVRRLGATHGTAHVWWFGTVPLLDDRLHLRTRFDAKIRAQVATGVPGSSNIGRSTVWSHGLRARELFCRNARPSLHIERTFAVARGPKVVLAALWWWTKHGCIPELIALRGPSYEVVQSFADIREIAGRLERSPLTDIPAPEPAMAALRQLLRHRLRWATDSSSLTSANRPLARRLMEHARTASQHRCTDSIDLMNQTLDHLSVGIRIGRERELRDLLPHCTDTELRAWCATPDRATHLTHFSVDALLFGDGSRSI